MPDEGEKRARKRIAGSGGPEAARYVPGGHGAAAPGDALFRAIVENSTEIIKIVGPDGTLRYASPAIERVMGYGPEEMVGRNVLDYVHPDDLPRVASETKRALAQTGVARSTAAYRFRHKDGSWRHVESTGTYLLDDPAVEGVVVISRDVTQRVRAEETSRKLRRVEEEYRTLVETVPAVTYVEDFRTGDTLYDSPQIEEILGYPADTCRRDPSYWKKILHPDDRGRVADEEARSVEGGHLSLEYRVFAADGRVVWLRDESRVVHGPDGEPLVWQGLLFDVTERKKTERGLQEAEERYRAIVEQTPAITYVFGQEAGGRSVPLYVSPQIERILGCTPEEYVSDPGLWQRMLHPEDRRRVLAEDVRTGETGETFRIEFRMVAKNGRIAWFREEGRLVHAEEGSAQRWHGVMFDITELKETEKRLRVAEERYRTLVENAPAVVYVDVPEGPGYGGYTSPRAEAVFGYPMEAWDSDPRFWTTILHPDDRGWVVAENERANAEGAPLVLEYRMVAEDGTAVWVRDESTVLRDEGGEPRHRQGILLDVTARKEAERALREAEARYRTLVEQIPAVTYVDRYVDPDDAEGDDEPVYVSPQVEGMLGYAPEEWLGQRLWPQRLHPDDRERVLAADGRFERGEDMRFGEEYRLLAKDGTVVWVREEAMSVKGEAGEPLYWQGVMLDVTERKEAERRLRESEERFRALVQNASDIVTVLEADGTIRYESPSIERVLGYKPEGLIGKNALEYVHPEDAERVMLRLRGRADADVGAGSPVEYRIRHTDGSWRYVESVASNLLTNLVVEGIVINSRDVTERKALERRLEHRALHDTLTGLPNRDLLSDRLAHALARAGRDGSSVAVLFLDLDNFKYVNDSLGHEVGDRLLGAVAGRLRDILRPGDTAARLGGDEFAALLEGVEDDGEASRVAERIVEATRAPFALEDAPGGREVFVTPSVGVVLGNPGRGDSPGDLLRRADAAMYRAKADGKARHAAFDPVMEVEARARLELENDLRRALERGEFTVFYQPVVRLPTGRIAGFEALLRWEHPERGLLAPDAFFSLAEELGLTVPIGRLVLREACRWTRRWQEGHPQKAPLSIGVNLSARQLSDPGLLGDVEAARREAGLLAEQVTLEVTEDTAVGDSGARLDALRGLRNVGFLLALDDFGTGQSSLSGLKRLPVGLLKIDRSFVEGLGGTDAGEDQVLLSGVAGIAHGLGMGVVAEGVETPEQLAGVEALGCDLAQGLLFSGPVPGEVVGALLEGGVPR